jgi:LCP family protein required for cell wall assembly
MNCIWNRLLSTLLCVALLVSMPFAALAQSSLDATEDVDQSIAANPDLTDAEKQQWQQWASEDATEETAASQDDALVAQLEGELDDSSQLDAKSLENLEVNTDLPDDVVNVLLLGVDNRSEELETGRSDAVIICSIRKDGTVKLTSVTRDTAVIIPGYKNKNRINCAFKFGSKDGDLVKGAYLAMKTVNRNFQMNISKYVLVNIHGLANIIDALGGVDMDMTSIEANRINYELRKEPMDKVKREKVKDIEGVQHLDGMQAVTFARIRGIDDDFARTERQRKLLSTLMAQVMKNIDTAKLLELIETALPYGKTNLTAADMFQLGGYVIGGSAMANLQSGQSVVEQLRLPLDGTWKYGGDGDATLTVFRIDARIKENIEAMQEFIYGQSYYKD